MDKELLQLCIDVRHKVGWGNAFDFEYSVTFDDDDKIVPTPTNYMGPDIEYLAPVFTSDYLLERLPKFSPVAKDCYLTVMEKQTPRDKREDFYWTAGYFSGHGWSFTGQSDTPLKALLKLTISLHEASALREMA